MSVAVVVEPEVEEGVLLRLLAQYPVWVIETPANRAVCRRIWAVKDPGLAELTIYDVNNPADRLKNCLNVVGTVELHHPLDGVLILIGVADTEELITGFEGFGYAIERGLRYLSAKREVTRQTR
ncbi:MAG: hypothetical protein JSS87_03730 [Acidobacteria bacterium]|nr:hypothetical protein [Acidobacteriota bacterium]